MQEYIIALLRNKAIKFNNEPVTIEFIGTGGINKGVFSAHSFNELCTMFFAFCDEHKTTPLDIVKVS